MFLDFLFISMDLLLDSIDSHIDRCEQIGMLILCDKVVLMFGIDFDFDFLETFVVQIHRDFDHGDAIEVMEEFFRFSLNLCLMFFSEMPVTGRYSDLHSREPPTSG